jgi:hypothetical protein
MGEAVKLGDVGSGELWDPNLADGEILAVRRPSENSLAIDVLSTVSGSVLRLSFEGVDRYRIHFASGQFTGGASFTKRATPDPEDIKNIVFGENAAFKDTLDREIARFTLEIKEGRLVLFRMSGVECDIAIVCNAVSAEALPRSYGEAFPRPRGLR